MKVLIAEDDPIALKTLEAALRDWGYEVIAALNGKDAWNLMQQEAPPLAILDWMMPEMSGIELIRNIRANLNQPAPHLILLTSRDEKKDLLEGLAAGANDYLTKPFDDDELRVRMKIASEMVQLQA